MDKLIINDKTAQTVQFINFLFAPNFNLGLYNARFNLVMRSPGMDKGYKVTSDVVDIHVIDDIVYVETLNSLYQLDGSETIPLDAVRQCLQKKMDSLYFYNNHLPNRLPTTLGWMVF